MCLFPTVCHFQLLSFLNAWFWLYYRGIQKIGNQTNCSSLKIITEAELRNFSRPGVPNLWAVGCLQPDHVSGRLLLVQVKLCVCASLSLMQPSSPLPPPAGLPSRTLFYTACKACSDAFNHVFYLELEVLFITFGWSCCGYYCTVLSTLKKRSS